MESPLDGIEQRRERLRAFSQNARHIGVIAMVTVVVLAGAVPFVVGVASAAPQEVNSCTTITEPGTYHLTQDIVDSGQAACIKIWSNDVVFDGGGNTIDGHGEGIGIYAGGLLGTLENVTVTNTVVTDWATGIKYLDVTNGALTENDVRRTTDAGILFVRSDGNALTGNDVVANTGNGMVIYLSDDNTLVNNRAANNGGGGLLGGSGFGIWLSVAHDNELRDNTVSNNVLNGIHLSQSYRNELVANTVTDNVDNGIVLDASKHTVVRDNTVSNNGRTGIYLSTAYDAVIAGNVVEHNGGDGIYILQFDNSTVMNNTIDSNMGDGVELDHSSESEMMGNDVYENHDSGIALAGYSSHNSIYNNYFYNDDNVEVEFDYDGTDNVWNATGTPGTNVLGDSVVAGNYWATDDGTGFSQMCGDADWDGVCDEPHALPGDNVDSAPLAPNTLTIRGTGSYASYSFTVDRDLAGRGLTAEDELGDVSASGAVRGGADRYVFTSEITEISVTGDVEVLVNGEPIDVGQTNTLTIRGTGSYASYSFSVSGDLAGDGLSSEDEITEASAEGAVKAGVDKYEFTGELSDVNVMGDAAVFVNGEPVAIDRSHTLTIRGSGSYASYSFAVSGDLTGAGLSSEDEITGASAEGAVSAGADRYEFTGELSDLAVAGDVTVLVDGKEITTDRSHTLTIRGTGSYASYSVSVSGDLAGDGLSSEDEITGASASGAVRAGADRYVFTGEITDITIEGEATVLVDGKVVNPARL